MSLLLLQTQQILLSHQAAPTEPPASVFVWEANRWRQTAGYVFIFSVTMHFTHTYTHTVWFSWVVRTSQRHISFPNLNHYKCVPNLKQLPQPRPYSNPKFKLNLKPPGGWSLQLPVVLYTEQRRKILHLFSNWTIQHHILCNFGKEDTYSDMGPLIW